MNFVATLVHELNSFASNAQQSLFPCLGIPGYHYLFFTDNKYLQTFYQSNPEFFSLVRFSIDSSTWFQIKLDRFYFPTATREIPATTVQVTSFPHT